MRQIFPFNDKERDAIFQIKSVLERADRSEELQNIENNEHALEEVTRAVSLYPSMYDKQFLGSNSRSIDTLVENLCVKDIMDLVLNIPTKAILGQGFVVAKINFFYMLHYLTQEIESLSKLQEDILQTLFDNVYGIMAEEVFISIVSDKNISMHVRSNAGYLLAKIWECRIDHGVVEFAPILNNIWSARQEFTPSYGTLMGITEIFKISEKTDPILLDYLMKDDLIENELLALQEFLMGLSYEEMKFIEEDMKQKDKKSLSRDDIEKLIGEKKIYPDYISGDPKEAFRSFTHRKNNSVIRGRAKLNGPVKTIEEYIMIFLLARPETASS